jgi:hypothetical protein
VATGVLATVVVVPGGPAAMTLQMRLASAPGQFFPQQEG